jgi:arsenite methyltransferase
MEPGRSTPGLWSDVMDNIWRPGGLELTDRAVRYCDFPAQARIVDVGCGRGATVDHLRGRHGFQAWGVDIRMEALAGTPPGFQIQAKAETLPLVAGSLDGLFCECVLSLLASPESALREFNRVLHPKGYLVITDLYQRRPVGCLEPDLPPGNSCLEGATGRREGMAQIERAGFDLLCWEDHSPLLAELTARLVWELGSKEALFEKLSPGAGDLVEKTSCARPGYFLLIARRKGSPDYG